MEELGDPGASRCSACGRDLVNAPEELVTLFGRSGKGLLLMHCPHCKHRADPETEHKSVKLGTLHIEICPNCGEGCLDCECDPEPESKCIFCDDKGYVGGVQCTMCPKPAPTPGPAKDEPAQQHGFKVGDVVATDLGFAGVIEEIEGGRCKLRYADGLFDWPPADTLTPIHRCPAVKQHTIEMPVPYRWYIAQPGNLREPFGECSEEPYPVGTVAKLATSLWWEIDSVEVYGDSHFLLYRSGRGDIHPDDIKEARLPEHEVCKDCGCAFIIKKETTNA